MSKRLVALSAAYGAGGRWIGTAAATRLGVPVVDRAIARAVAARLEVPIDEALQQEEPPGSSLLERLLSSFVGADTGAPLPLPVQARLRRALAVSDIDQATAMRTLRRFDRTHAEYFRQFHDVDIDDPSLYHLTIASTSMPLEACVDLVDLAAGAVT